MHNFEYRQGELYCEQVPVSQIAKQVGTPCYIYSHATLVRHIRAYDSAFKNIPHLIAFAMKANSNLAILRLMAKEGSGVDIVSGGELFRALKAGVSPSKIVFAGVGKNAEEIRDALKAEILMFNIESSAEMHAINDVAASVGKIAPVALRINPDIDPKTHPYISTGLKKSKFGIAADRALEEFRVASTLRHIHVVGVHAHIGSQLTEVTPFVESLKKVLALVEPAQRAGDQHPVSQHRRRAGHYLFRRKTAIAARIGRGPLAARQGIGPHAGHGTGPRDRRQCGHPSDQGPV